MLVNTLLDYIKKLEDKDFNEKIEILEKEFENDIKEYEDSAFKDAQNSLKCKNYHDLVSYVSLTEKKKENRDKEFVDVLEMFLIKWEQQK